MPFIPTLESEVEDYLVAQARTHGVLLRKVKWIGRCAAPDRLLMFKDGRLVWVELKAPGKFKTFPKTALERAQWREHRRMRLRGQVVVVVDSRERVDALFSGDLT